MTQIRSMSQPTLRRPGELGVHSLDHFNFVVPDVAQAEKFYGLFGLNTMYPSYRYALGNRVLTFAANVAFDAYISDLHTCLKMMPLELFRQLELREVGFGIDTEITGKLLLMGIRPFEVPISYYGRSHDYGKKITWHSGVECLRILSRVRLRWAPPATALPTSDEAVAALEDEVREELVRAASRQGPR